MYSGLNPEFGLGTGVRLVTYSPSLLCITSAIVDELKGEFVIIVDGNHTEINYADLSIVEHVNLYIKDGMSSNDAIKIVAKERGISKSIIYKEYHLGK